MHAALAIMITEPWPTRQILWNSLSFYSTHLLHATYNGETIELFHFPTKALTTTTTQHRTAIANSTRIKACIIIAQTLVNCNMSYFFFGFFYFRIKFESSFNFIDWYFPLIVLTFDLISMVSLSTRGWIILFFDIFFF